MSKQLTVEVRQKASKGETGWEGRVAVPGTNATRLAKRDGATLFTTRGSLNSAARALGKRLNLDVEFAEPQRKAAKKSVKTKTATPTS